MKTYIVIDVAGFAAHKTDTLTEELKLLGEQRVKQIFDVSDPDQPMKFMDRDMGFVPVLPG